MKHIIYLLTIVLISCNFKNIEEQTDDLGFDFISQVPLEVDEYMRLNTHEWSYLTLNDYNSAFLDDLMTMFSMSEENYPFMLHGDFTMDNKEDFAIILKDKTNIPYLVVFNNYKDNISPIPVLKTGEYVDEDDMSVIFHQDGVLTYLEGSTTCDKNVIDLIYYEKSSFFVYWDATLKEYRILNYLEEDMCDIVHSKDGGKAIIQQRNQFADLIGEWCPDCRWGFGLFFKSEGTELKAEFPIHEYRNIGVVASIKRTNNGNEFILTFDNSFNYSNRYGPDINDLKDAEISKDEPIAKIYVLENGNLEFHWIGLYNTKTKTIEITGIENLYIEMNDGKNPVVLKRCE